MPFRPSLSAVFSTVEVNQRLRVFETIIGLQPDVPRDIYVQVNELFKLYKYVGYFLIVKLY